MRDRFRAMVHPRQWLLALSMLWVMGGSLPAAAPTPGFINGLAAASWEFSSGVQSGMIKEYVFSGNYLLSRLDWDIDLLSSLGTALHFRSGHWIFGFSVVLGLPANTGWMKDYDWADRNTDGLTYNGVLSNYSEHDLFMDHALRLELSGYLQLGGFLGGKVWFGASLGWQRYAMQGMDGFYEYPPGTGENFLTGKVISYTTDQILPMIGLLSEWSSKTLSASLELRGSIIGYERAYDQHHMRSLDFYDYFIFLPSLEVSASLSFAFSATARWFLSATLAVFPETRGASYMTDLSVGKSYELTSEGGASSWFLGFETGLQFLISE